MPRSLLAHTMPASAFGVSSAAMPPRGALQIRGPITTITYRDHNGQSRQRDPIAHVDRPDGQDTAEIYAVAEVAGAQHPQAAQAGLELVRSSEALVILERYGFKPYEAAKPDAN